VTRGASLARLPGTAAEVSAIAALLRKNGWTSQTFVGDRALEQALISDVHGPRVLHLATHGAFLADPQRPAALAAALPQVPAAPAGSGTATEVAPVVLPPLADAELGSPQNDPMLRSMLFFAGANRTWTGQSTPPGGLDNGILTAAEASTLDLRGTELVVLSACETGLGSTQSGEGVFGLRRALREAGAGSILMSLWKIPDTETAEMLKAFYTHWLAGDEPHAALAKAQREERAIVQKRYGSDDPYYWGGLVLVGPPQR
jgi:CHAT domain-containing protein